MYKIKSLAIKIRQFYSSGQFTTNTNAAAIIRRFVAGAGDPYEWDGLESIDQTNPDVDIAINLCWYYAAKFPAANEKEYCGRNADKFFLRIADALEEGRFAGLDRAVMKRDLQSGRLPDPLHSIVEGGAEDIS